MHNNIYNVSVRDISKTASLTQIAFSPRFFDFSLEILKICAESNFTPEMVADFLLWRYNVSKKFGGKITTYTCFLQNFATKFNFIACALK
jgi:hypothetical protein